MPEMAVKPTTPATRTGRILADFVRDSGNADLVEDIEEEAALAERARLREALWPALQAHKPRADVAHVGCPLCPAIEAVRPLFADPDTLRREGVL